MAILTGVPLGSIVSSAEIINPKGTYIYIQINSVRLLHSHDTQG